MVDTIFDLTKKHLRKKRREKEKRLTPESETDPKAKRVDAIKAKEGTKKKTIGKTPIWGVGHGSNITPKKQIKVRGRKVAERWTRKAKRGSKIMQGYKAGGKV